MLDFHLIDTRAQEFDVGATTVNLLLMLDGVLQNQILALVGERLAHLG